MTKTVRILGAMAVWGSLCGPLNGQANTLSGHVRDERLRPIQGAVVRVSLNLPPAARAKPVLLSTKTGRDGTFTLTAPPGSYRYCAQLPNSELLDSCAWTARADTIEITGGKATAAPAITLKRGYGLEVAVEDGGKVLAGLTASGPAKPLLIGIRGGNGMFTPLAAQPRRGNLYEYRILVPRDTPLELSVYSREVALADGGGAALDVKKGVRIPVNVSGSRTQRRFTFKVTGKQTVAKP